MFKKLEGKLYGKKANPYITEHTEDFCIAMQNALTEIINGYSDVINAAVIEHRHQSEIGNSMYCNHLQKNIGHYRKMRDVAERDLEMFKTFRKFDTYNKK